LNIGRITLISPFPHFLLPIAYSSWHPFFSKGQTQTSAYCMAAMVQRAPIPELFNQSWKTQRVIILRDSRFNLQARLHTAVSPCSDLILRYQERLATRGKGEGVRGRQSMEATEATARKESEKHINTSHFPIPLYTHPHKSLLMQRFESPSPLVALNKENRSW
jgi:hypothetical protein